MAEENFFSIVSICSLFIQVGAFGNKPFQVHFWGTTYFCISFNHTNLFFQAVMPFLSDWATGIPFMSNNMDWSDSLARGFFLFFFF